MIREAEVFHLRPGPRRKRGRREAGFAPAQPEPVHTGSLAAGGRPKCAKQSQFAGRDCFGASLLAMTRARLGAIVSNKANSVRFWAENEGRAQNKANPTRRWLGRGWAEPGGSTSEALHPERMQWPEDERRNAKQSQFFAAEADRRGPKEARAKQSQFAGRDCFGASLLAMTRAHLGPAVSNKPNFVRFWPENEGRGENKANLCGRQGRDWGFGIGDCGWRGRLEGRMSNKANLGHCRPARRARVCETKPIRRGADRR